MRLNDAPDGKHPVVQLRIANLEKVKEKMEGHVAHENHKASIQRKLDKSAPR